MKGQDYLRQLISEIVIAYDLFVSRPSCIGQTMDFQLRNSDSYEGLYGELGTAIKIFSALTKGMPGYLLRFAPDGQGCLEVIAREHLPPPIEKKFNKPDRHEIPTPSMSAFVMSLS